MSDSTDISSSLLGKSLSTDELPIHIVGGGIAGLFLAYFLKKKGRKFTIYEKKERTGGLLNTLETPYGLVETAANGFIWTPLLQSICDDIHLEILPPAPASKARYILRNKKLRRFPLSVLETVRSFARFLSPHQKNIQTVEDFGLTYFGKSFTYQILEPAMAGIFGGKISQLSFEASLPMIAEKLHYSRILPVALWKGRTKKKEKKGVKKMTTGTHSFAGGMNAFVSHLTHYLQENIQYNIEDISFLPKNEPILFCTPAYITASFFPIDSPLNTLLKSISYTSFVTATWFFDKKDLPLYRNGFGCLIPSNENLNIVGVLFNSSIFSNRVKNPEHISITTMLRDDSPEKKYIHASEQVLKTLIFQDLKQVFGAKNEPLQVFFTRWENAIPLYSIDIKETWEKIDTSLKTDYPTMRLFGNYTGSISLRGMAEAAFQEVEKMV